MTERPYVLLSCAISVDGCLDAPGPQRLILSGKADLDRVDEERAQADAIMVGAGTIRRDDPRLLIRAPERQAARAAAGLPEHPAGVTITASGDLDPGARFFHGPAGLQRLVYCPAPLAPKLESMLNGHAQVIPIAPPARLGAVLTDLTRRGVHRLLVEGGAELGRQFLADGLVDELELAVAPFFVGDAAAPRFAGPATYPHGPGRPMRLAEVRRLDGIVLLKYLMGDGDGQGAAGGEGAPGEGAEATGADWRWLRRAIELSRRCPPSPGAFAVGAVVVAGDGSVLATGYSREGRPQDHAEEAALAKLDPADPRLGGVAGSGLAERGVAGSGLAKRGVAGSGLAERGVAGSGLAERGVAGSGLAEPGATLYSSLEPCRFRASRPIPCAELIIEAGLRRVVFAWREPPLFAEGGGAGLLREAGVTVVEIPGLAAEARAVNAAVLGEGAAGP